MLLSPDEINKTLSSYGWDYKNKTISKTYKFETYMDGIDFVQKIAELAEKHNHHPDINIGWCKVDLLITSHNMGGVSTKCINLATGIDLIIK
ncbi:4a-hydroxytetrahydrobiopterin dehydratase [Candidatus Pelagibacter communis]|uniref:4a-hydroxytetrahydrobiopterin dehydratase n=1 Tax=Pelagibacter ubique TaxID=198252 RepID=UPI00094C94A2|nr:4a-hydroxytetrahydrobiopterin dehydratase [Candidatus Pelagibacter ubique]